MTIGKTIRQYRKNCGLTQAQLAQKVGVSVQAVSKWETDAGLPDISQIAPLARALQISTDMLLGFRDRREDFEKLWHETVDRSHAAPPTDSGGFPGGIGDVSGGYTLFASGRRG